MASAPDTPPPVMGRVDAIGRLVEADPMLADLQTQAGSEVGARLALPQLAAVARLVRKLGISVSRPAVVAGRDHDVEMWVRAEPAGEVTPISAVETAELLREAKNVVIVPGYGMAVAQAQHVVCEIVNVLRENGVNVRL